MTERRFRARVRMYRQGLGDCFLLTFPRREGRPFHLLLDFGALGRKTEFMVGIARQIKEDCGGRLDVVVATHEHRDHLSGFNQARELFNNEIEIGAVWLPWTENLSREEVRSIKTARRKAARTIREGLRMTHDPLWADGVASVLGFNDQDDTAPSDSVVGALEYLKLRGETAENLRYLEPGEGPLTMDGVDGWRVFVLGPPRDPSLLKGSEVTESMRRGGVVYHLNAAGMAGLDALEAAVTGSAEERSQPLSPEHRIPRNSPVFPAIAEFVEQTYDAPENEWRRIDGDWLGAIGQLALDLDNDTNNTSLVLAFEHIKSGRVLLFPGDAQVGNWLSWANVEFQVRGRSKPVKAHDLVRRTVFYKVGHHGSHNATLQKGGLELMARKDLVAFIPLDFETARIMRWKMPAEALMKELRDRTGNRIAISDPSAELSGEAKAAGIEATEVYVDWFLTS